jgi:hypothetical protein
MLLDAMSKYQLWSIGVFLMLPEDPLGHQEHLHHDLQASLGGGSGWGMEVYPFPTNNSGQQYGRLECDDGNVSNIEDCPEGWTSMVAVGPYLDLGSYVLIFDAEGLSGIGTESMTDKEIDAMEAAVARGYIILD